MDIYRRIIKEKEETVKEHIRASDARSAGPRPATGRADESPTELPVPTLAPAPTSPRTRAAAGGPSPTDMPPVPTAVPSPTSPVPTDQREDEQTVPVGTAPRPGAARPRAPSSPTQGVSIPVDVPDATSPDEAPEDKVLAPRRAAKEAGQSSRHTPTFVAPTPATELIGPPSRMPAASRKESSDTLASSPTEMPVPTAAPSPTSHVPVDEDEQVRPPRPKTSRPGAPAPSSPTEIPLPPVDVQTATSPVPLEGEEVITLAPAGASARRSRAPSSPTEMPVPTAVPTPTSPVASPDDDAVPGPPERRAVTQISARAAPSSPTGLPVPTAAPSPTSQVPMVDEERVQPPRAPPAARPRGLDAPSSPTEMPVPTAVPSPTSPVATDGDDDEKVPGPVVRHPVTQISARPVPPASPTESQCPRQHRHPRRKCLEADDMLPPKPKVRRIHPPGRAAPSSPTELPLPAGAAEPTSLAPSDEEEQVGMAPSVPPRRKGAAPSSPTEMPVPSESKRAAAAPPKPVGTTTPSSPTELPVPTEMPAPTSPAEATGRTAREPHAPYMPKHAGMEEPEPKDDEEKQNQVIARQAAADAFDKEYPRASMPRGARYFMHDHRDEKEKKESRPPVRVKGRLNRDEPEEGPDAPGKWKHDKYEELYGDGSAGNSTYNRGRASAASSSNSQYGGYNRWEQAHDSYDRRGRSDNEWHQGKGKGQSKYDEPSKGKGKGKYEDFPKGKSKGKGKYDEPKGKSKGKGKYDEPKGKGKGGKGKGKAFDYYDYPPAPKGRGKYGEKGKGKDYWY